MPRAKVLRDITLAELREDTRNTPDIEGVERPRTRGDCRDAQRPCPWVSCRYHLYLDINPRTGSIKVNFPDLEPWELKHTCALDVADHGGKTLEEVGELTNLTRERARQIEVRGLLVLNANVRHRGIKREDAHFAHPAGQQHLDDAPTRAEYLSNRARKRAKDAA